MSAQPVPTQPGLDEVTRAFLTEHGNLLRDPDTTRERCHEISADFAQRCTDAGIAATVVIGARFGEVPEFPGVRLLLSGHAATLVTLDDTDTDTVYDWTARQFDPTADVPEVMPLTRWRTEWVQPDQW